MIFIGSGFEGVDFDESMPGGDASFTYVTPGGTPGGGSTTAVISQTSPAATWTLQNPFGRYCLVDVYVGDEQVDADVEVSLTQISVIFAAPQSGYIVIA